MLQDLENPRSSTATENRRRGHTLLEVVLAGVLLATALVPALRLMRDGLAISRRIETRELLTTFCTSKLEEHLALCIADWQTGNYAGDFTAEGYANLRFSVTRSDLSADGGITDQLMALTATAWEDSNGSGTVDADEPSVVLGTKIAKLESYIP